MVVAVLAVVAVFVGVAVVMYVMSGDVGCTSRGGSFRRLLLIIPLQSVKIVIVAWQVLAQVRPKRRVLTGGFNTQEHACVAVASVPWDQAV